MLIKLTPNVEIINKNVSYAKECGIGYTPFTYEAFIIEHGIYEIDFAHNFCHNEFLEDFGHNYNDYVFYKNKIGDEKFYNTCDRVKDKLIRSSGFSESIDQIKEIFKEQINDKEEKFFIDTFLAKPNELGYKYYYTLYHVKN